MNRRAVVKVYARHKMSRKNCIQPHDTSCTEEDTEGLRE